MERPLRTSRLPSKAIVGALASAMAAMCLAGLSQRCGPAAPPAWLRTGSPLNPPARRLEPRLRLQSIFSARAIPVPITRGGGVLLHLGRYHAQEDLAVIWGDSHANSWSVAAILAKERGARLVELSTVVACPPILAVRRLVPHQHHGEACNDINFAGSTMAKIEYAGRHKLRPSWRRAGRFTSTITTPWAWTIPSSPPIPPALRRFRPVRAAMQNADSRHGEETGALRSVADHRNGADPASSDRSGLARDPKGYEPSLAEYRALEAAPNAIAQKLARDIPGVSLLDPATVLCDARKCHAFRGGVRVYENDVTHLSDAGAMLFMPVLRKLVK